MKPKPVPVDFLLRRREILKKVTQFLHRRSLVENLTSEEWDLLDDLIQCERQDVEQALQRLQHPGRFKSATVGKYSVPIAPDADEAAQTAGR